jgi:hypothetical protein
MPRWWMTANLTDTDLFRNVNHISVERDRSAVDAAVASVLLLEEDTPDAQAPRTVHRGVTGSRD